MVRSSVACRSGVCRGDTGRRIGRAEDGRFGLAHRGLRSIMVACTAFEASRFKSFTLIVQAWPDGFNLCSCCQELMYMQWCAFARDCNANHKAMQ